MSCLYGRNFVDWKRIDKNESSVPIYRLVDEDRVVYFLKYLEKGNERKVDEYALIAEELRSAISAYVKYPFFRQVVLSRWAGKLN